MSDIFSEIEAAAEEEQLKPVDLGPVSKLVEEQWKLERPASDSIVKSLYLKWSKMNASIPDLEEVLKLAKKDLFKIRQEQIPEFMKEVNLQSLTTGSGVSIEIKKDVSPTIKHPEKFFAFLENENFGALIKDIITVTVDNPENMKEVIDQLDQTDCLYERKRSVHNQTLKKYVKDHLAEGRPLPDGEVLSVFEYSYSNIMKKKGK